MMDITRHKSLVALVCAVACCAAYANPVKSMNAAKQQAIMKKSSGKVWTWKEMFFNITENTWPEKQCSRQKLPTSTGLIGYIPAKKIKEVCFLASEMKLSNNCIAYSSPALAVVKCPNISSVGYPSHMMNGSVTDYHIPKVKSFGQNQYTFYGFTTMKVHIAESTCAEILAFKNFPGCQASKYPDITFHGSDGTVYWDGVAWTTKSEGAEAPYTYEDDVCPTFTDDPADEYWRDMFFKFTEDTWGTTAAFPAEVNTIKRQLWLTSSTLVEVTFLCESFTFDHNSAAGGSSKIRIVNMPNTIMYDWCSPTQNGQCTELHIPKCKTFKSNMSFDTRQARMDVYIDESTCDQIRNFKNFPGCIAAQMSKIVFHGSDGTLAYNGSEWVFTAN